MVGIEKNSIIRGNEFLENASTDSTYTITGTLTNNKGTFSGFSTANYITTNAEIGAHTSSFIVHGSYITGSDITNEQYIACTSPIRGFSIRLAGSKFSLGQAPNGNNGGWTNVVNGTTTLAAHTKYYFSVVGTSTNWYFYLNNNLEINLTVASGTAEDSNLGFGQHTPTHVAPALGGIDIKDWTIIKNGKLVWSGADAYLVNTNAKIGKNYISSNNFYEL